MLAWYCAITLPFQELTAEEHLKRQGFTPFNPKVETVKVNGTREVITRKPWISGYIFVPFDINDPHWRVINSTRGVKQLMYGAHERPARIRQDAMNVLLEKCNGQMVRAALVDQALSKIFWPGASVKVTDGPFASFPGKVEWSQRDRVRVLVEIFGRSTPVELTPKQVELV